MPGVRLAPARGARIGAAGKPNRCTGGLIANRGAGAPSLRLVKFRLAVCSALAAGASLSTAQAAEAPITLLATTPDGARAPLVGLVRLRGEVSGARADDVVRITEKQCGLTVFALLLEAHVDANGAFVQTVGANIKTEFRAEWRGRVSAPVSVDARPSVRLKQVTRSRFRVEVVGLRYFRQAQFQLQRLTRGRWVTIKRARLTRAFPAGTNLWTTGDVVAAPARGTNVRVVLPDGQTGPCYIAGLSNRLVVRR